MIQQLSDMQHLYSLKKYLFSLNIEENIYKTHIQSTTNKNKNIAAITLASLAQ